MHLLDREKMNNWRSFTEKYQMERRSQMELRKRIITPAKAMTVQVRD